MIVAKITSKGQVTIPKKVRQKLGVGPGETVGFEEKNGMFVMTKVVEKSPFDEWAGKLTHLKGKRSDDLVKAARGHDSGS
jgi:antitoxin PrlF